MPKRSFQVFTVLLDIVILAISFLFMVWIKPASKSHYLPTHMDFFLILAILWLVISIAGGKMHRGKIINLRSLFSRTIITNFVSISIASFLLIALAMGGHSRLIMFGTTVLATFIELVVGTVYLAVKKASLQDYQPRKDYYTIRKLTEEDMVGQMDTNGISEEINKAVDPEVRKALIQECGMEMANGILNIAKWKLNGQSRIMSTATEFNISALPEKDYNYIINLKRINDIRDLDHFLDAVNHKVRHGGYFMCCVETKDLRKRRILKKFPPVLNYIYYTGDFMIKRVFPKIRITRWLYLALTKGNNVVISRAEALGRMVRAGFSISNESFINGYLYIEGKKNGSPLNVYGKNYGVLIALPRIGRNGNFIRVYKLRTMHPYSEYIQDYVYGLHSLEEGGKFRNDFRITSWGAFSRKVWLDELPMLLNFFQGDMKLVGVRPLSKQYFSLYSPEMRERRVKYKPGLIPPFYYDMPGNMEEIEASERRYLEAYDKHPVRTDIRYFSKSIINILFHKARSN
ncbi:MAG: sugar transferase [Bacteroidales bacterium]|nr:sugar transferase [Bacteroidales bacterium]